MSEVLSSLRSEGGKKRKSARKERDNIFLMQAVFAVLASAVAFMFCGSQVFAGDSGVLQYKHLSNWVDKPARCGLKREDAVWLEGHIREGALRLANEKDIQAWKDAAAKAGQVLPFFDCGRTFVVVREMEFISPRKDVPISGDIAFIVSKEVEFPEVVKIRSPFYDLKSGGASQGGICIRGDIEGIGHNPRTCK